MTNTSDVEDPLSALQRDYSHNPTPDRIAVYKAVGLSGGAVCLAVLLAATQFTTKNNPAYIAIYAALIAMPCWFYFGGIHDYYLLLGSESYAHLASKETQAELGKVLLLGSFATVVALAGLAEYLAPYGSILFIAVGLVAGYKGMQFHYRLAKWWAARPASNEPR